MAQSNPLHRVSIFAPGISGLGSRVYLDGVEVKGLRRINLNVQMEEANVLILELIVDGVNVEAGVEPRIKSEAGYVEGTPPRNSEPQAQSGNS